MTIGELINNPEFTFNAPFRILYYSGEGDETTVMYDSEKAETGDISFDLMDRTITAINIGDDGVLEIEYMLFIYDGCWTEV